MKKLLLLFSLLFYIFTGKAEGWTPVGQAEWREGIVNVLLPEFCGVNWKVAVERSDENPNLLRMQPYVNHPVKGDKDVSGYSTLEKDDVYVYLDITNHDKVYIKTFKYVYFEDAANYHRLIISQRVPENGFDTNYYGKLEGYTIEFKSGSFSSEAPHWQDNPTFISNTYHKIVLNSDILGYTPIPEKWIVIGTGHWEDPFWSNGDKKPYSQNIKVEKSVQHPNRYRTKLHGLADYITIYTDDPDKVYISPYTGEASTGELITVAQNCAENGMSGEYYGTLNNGQIIIPGDFFVCFYPGSSAKSNCDSSRSCKIRLPDGFDNPLPEDTEDNGVFMGIIGFNDEVKRKPISILDENSKDEFTSFVNDLEMGNATLLYYAVDQAIASMKAQTFPKNLSNALLLTFTDGLDQGSLAMKPGFRTSKEYADYLSNLITNTSIQSNSLDAYAIGMKSEDVYDDEMFKYNLKSLTSKEENISSVNNIDELQQKLTEILENLNKQTTQRVLTIKVPMMSHGDLYRFTLDHSRSSMSNSSIWFEGTFNIDNMSLENVTYHGFTSISGPTLTAKQEGIKLIFTLNDCRDMEGEILDVEKDGIDQWQYVSSREIWAHNVENAKADDIDIQNIKSSVAIMFALDCSTSLGNLFPLVQATANSFIDRLAGGDGGNGDAGDGNIIIDDSSIDINDPKIEIYNLQGVKISKPKSGVYICRKGNSVRKIFIK